ncbi:hypothetical protein CDEF62S_00853 [Castellaniella defragrans]
MGRVRLAHHRGARCQRGSRVAAGHGKGQREVAGTEDRDGADGDVARADVAARRRFAVRQGMIDAGVQPVALAHDACEQAQLIDGAAALAFEPGAGQARFLHGAGDEFVAQIENGLRHGFQEGGALFQRGFAIHRKGGQCQLHRLIHLMGVRPAPGHGQGFAGGRIESVEFGAGAREILASDELGTGNGHERVLAGKWWPPRSTGSVGPGQWIPTFEQ